MSSIRRRKSVDLGQDLRLRHPCLYLLPPPIAQDALELAPDGTVFLRLRRTWRDGTRAIDLPRRGLGTRRYDSRGRRATRTTGCSPTSRAWFWYTAESIAFATSPIRLTFFDPGRGRRCLYPALRRVGDAAPRRWAASAARDSAPERQ